MADVNGGGSFRRCGRLVDGGAYGPTATAASAGMVTPTQQMAGVDDRRSAPERLSDVPFVDPPVH